MRAHASLRLGPLRGTTPELRASPWYGAWGFCVVWEAGLPHKTSSPRTEGVSHVLGLSEGLSKLIPIDEQPNHQIVHLFRLGKTNRTAH